MAKRAERRHHEERVKRKFRKVAGRYIRYDRFVGKWEHKWVEIDGKLYLISRHTLDSRGFNERERYIERRAVRMAHHDKCPCWMCHNQDYNRAVDNDPRTWYDEDEAVNPNESD